MPSCKHVACKCLAESDQECCGSYCEQVDPSKDNHRCGCGHSICDVTSQIGNETPFDATEN